MVAKRKTRPAVMSGSAVIQGDYRYTLARSWDSSKRQLLFIMLNPSTADETKDDPTIRRCIGFAEDAGYGGIVVANLFAYRATDPDNLPGDTLRASGPENEYWLTELARRHKDVVYAWGAEHIAIGQDQRVDRIFRAARCRVWCLAVTQRGAPRHPLFLAGSCSLQPYELPKRK